MGQGDMPQKKTNPANTLTLDLEPPGLRENTFPLLKPQVAFCDGSQTDSPMWGPAGQSEQGPWRGLLELTLGVSSLPHLQSGGEELAAPLPGTCLTPGTHTLGCLRL